MRPWELDPRVYARLRQYGGTPYYSETTEPATDFLDGRNITVRKEENYE